jgi:hypothetical protein
VGFTHVLTDVGAQLVANIADVPGNFARGSSASARALAILLVIVGLVEQVALWALVASLPMTLEVDRHMKLALRAIATVRVRVRI